VEIDPAGSLVQRPAGQSFNGCDEWHDIPMFDAQCDLAALVYEATQDPDRLLLAFAGDLRAQGLRPVGLVQRGHHDAGAAVLPALLLHTGEEFDLFQDATAYTEGRRLDVGKLAQARARMTDAVSEGADLLIVNRFGRQEMQVRGLAHLIEHALRSDVPVVVPVPRSGLMTGSDMSRACA
jgi:hypothetical protein